MRTFFPFSVSNLEGGSRGIIAVGGIMMEIKCSNQDPSPLTPNTLLKNHLFPIPEIPLSFCIKKANEICMLSDTFSSPFKFCCGLLAMNTNRTLNRTSLGPFVCWEWGLFGKKFFERAHSISGCLIL